MSEPDPPQGVRLKYDDGTTSDVLPLIYAGRDDDGIDVWEALAPDERMPVGVVASVIPGHAAVLVGFW
jgi:hypothetical protein